MYGCTLCLTFLFIKFLSCVEPYLPPSGVHLKAVESNQLVFAWNKVATLCSSIRYITTAINCGVCPKSTTNTSITCVINNVSAYTSSMCMFSVRTEICGHILGERSEYVIANLAGECEVCTTSV